MKNWPRPARIAFAAVIGLLGGGAGVALVAALRPEASLPIVIAAALPAMGIPIGGITHLLIWPSAKDLAKQAKAEQSIERVRYKEAAATAFAIQTAILIWCTVLDGLPVLSWLSPLTIWHVVAIAALSYALCYAQTRWSESRRSAR